MFTGTEDHEITLSAGTDLTARFQLLFPGWLKGKYISKASLQALIDQDGAVGVRVYYGFTSSLKISAVLVAVDEDENDLSSGLVVGSDMTCPPHCAESTPFID